MLCGGCRVRQFPDIQPDGQFLLAVAPFYDGPAIHAASGIAVDEDGRVYIVDHQYFRKVDILPGPCSDAVFPAKRQQQANEAVRRVFRNCRQTRNFFRNELGRFMPRP
jgi:hypothetical protein